MSFTEENKYLIIAFNRNIKGLKDNELKNVYDNEFKDKFRSKVIKYYLEHVTKTGDIFQFYSDLLEVLGEFEGAFILQNIFFEKKVDDIVFYLKRSKNWSTFTIIKSELLCLDFLNYINKDGYISTDDFLRKYFGNLIGISNSQWNPETSVGNPIINNYIEWVFKALSNPEFDKRIIYSGLMFNKIWDLRAGHYKDSSLNLVYILLVKYCAKYEEYLDQGLICDISKFKDLLKEQLDDIFVNELITSPFTGINNSFVYTPNEIKAFSKYDVALSLCDKLNKNHSRSSFIEIFQDMESGNKHLNKKLKNDILEKVVKQVYPTQLEIDEINNFEFIDEMLISNKRFFNDSFYLFEYI